MSTRPSIFHTDRGASIAFEEEAEIDHRKKAKDDDADVGRISMDYFFMSEEDRKASRHPLIVMPAERGQNRYMRATGKKGLGEGKEMEWLMKDMHAELKPWGYPGGGENPIMMRSVGEPSIVAVREALSRYHGGLVPPKRKVPRMERQKKLAKQS